MPVPELGVEQRGRLRPELLECGLETRLPLQALEPHLRVHAVVRLLAIDLRSEAGDLGIGRLPQPLEPDRVRFLVEIVTGDRLLPVQQAKLDDLRAAVVVGRPVERAVSAACKVGSMIPATLEATLS